MSVDLVHQTCEEEEREMTLREPAIIQALVNVSMVYTGMIQIVLVQPVTLLKTVLHAQAPLIATHVFRIENLMESQEDACAKMD